MKFLENKKNVLRVFQRVDASFLFLISVVVILNFPYARGSFFPRHDTMYVFENFYFFYNEFFFNNNLPQWMPYGIYGITSGTAQIATLTPADYLVFAFGKLFAIKNVIALFKSAVLLDQLIFLSGIYFLSHFFFKRKIVVLMVCLAAFCSMEWFHQYYFNFKLYNLFPWVIYWGVLFWESRRAVFFWMAGVTVVLWALGSWYYFSILWFWLMAVMGVALFMTTPGSLRGLSCRFRSDVIGMVIFFALLAAYGFFLKNSFHEVAVLTRSTVANSLLTFIRYGGTARLDLAVSWLFLGFPLHVPLGSTLDNTAYAGMITAFFFLWAVFFVRQKYFCSILAGFVFLVWLSFGGLLTITAYFLPGFQYYRHVGLVYPLAKILMVLGAGFGLVDFFKKSWKVRIINFLVVSTAVFLLIDVSFFSREAIISLVDPAVLADFLDGNLGSIVFRFGIYYVAFQVLLVVILVAALGAQLKKQPFPYDSLEKAIGVIFVAIIALELFSFQKALYDQSPRLPPKSLAALKGAQVSETFFIDRRSFEPTTEHQRLATLLKEGTIAEHSVKHGSFLAFAQMDTGGEGTQVVLLNAHVRKFANADFSERPGYKRVIGMEEPKLRLMTIARMFPGDQDAEDFMRTCPQLDKVLVLTGSDKMKDVASPGSTEVSELPGDIEVHRFTTDQLDLTVDIKEPNGAWLVYADAYHSGWRAYVDGVQRAVYKAYLAFKAVRVPQGRHQVRFAFFSPPTFFFSYFLAMVGFLFALAALWLILARLVCSFDLTAALLARFYPRE